MYGEKTADDKYIHSWTLGCLCDMTPDYMPINQWNHGFAVLELKGNDFTVNNLRIVNGEIKQKQTQESYEPQGSGQGYLLI